MSIKVRPTELGLRRLLAPTLQAVHGFSVETHTLPGVPDINHAHGWLELKVFKRWPRDPSGPALCHEPLKPTQRAWIMEREVRAPGTTHVMAQSDDGNEWFLFEGLWAARYLERVTEAECRLRAIGFWKQKLDQLQLRELLKRSKTTPQRETA